MMSNYDVNMAPMKVIKHVQRDYLEHTEYGAYFAPGQM